MLSKRKIQNSQFASLNSEGNIIFYNNLNNNYYGEFLQKSARESFVTSFTVSFTLAVIVFSLKVQVEA